MHRTLRVSTALGLALAVAAWPAVPRGGDFHTYPNLVCSDCHTMHNRSRGQPMRYDGNPTPGQTLLRNASSISLCLACHDGTNPDGPDVLAPVTYVGDPAGGAFTIAEGAAAGSHDLGVPGTPRDGAPPMTLTCLTCHGPHGTPNYRNLRDNPSRSGDPATPIVVNQATRADGSNPVQVYAASNLLYVSGMSQWCNDCHGSDPSGHPVDLAMSSVSPEMYASWSRGDRYSVPVNLAVGTVSVPRVPVQNPFGTPAPSPSDRIFCLTCHKAHGTSNAKMVRHPDGYSIDSACLQCHDM